MLTQQILDELYRREDAKKELLAILTAPVTYVGDDWQTPIELMPGTVVTFVPSERLLCHDGCYFQAEPFEYCVLA